MSISGFQPASALSGSYWAVIPFAAPYGPGRPNWPSANVRRIVAFGVTQLAAFAVVLAVGWGGGPGHPGPPAPTPTVTVSTTVTQTATATVTKTKTEAPKKNSHSATRTSTPTPDVVPGQGSL